MQEVIKKSTGPCVILAGAGTGKTYTIVEKMKYLIENNIYAPEKIVCLTFSNEAVASLQRRITTVIPSLAPPHEPVIRTFHSFCADLLRMHGSKIGIKDSFRILLPDDAKILLHKSFKLHPRLCIKYIDTIGIAKDLGIAHHDLDVHLTQTLAEKKIDNLERALEYLQFSFNTLHLGAHSKRSERGQLKDELALLGTLYARKKFLQAWRAYEKIKEKRSLLDYADLHIYALALLENYPEISKNYDYIIVDEFQDTNKMQCNLLKALALHHNITVVGDINQSIYRFRGAYRDNVAEFKRAFNVEQKDIAALDKSYRSPNTVLRVAHKLIEHNYFNKEECIRVLNSEQREGSPVKVIELANDKEEVRKIIELIRTHQQHDVPLEEMCIMFRTHHQSRRLKRELEEAKIPYVSVTRTSLLSLPYIRKLINYTAIASKLAHNSRGGEQAWWELIYNEKISPDDFAQISRLIKKNMEQPCLSAYLLKALSTLELTPETKDKISLLVQNMVVIKEFTSKPAHEALTQIQAQFSADMKNSGDYVIVNSNPQELNVLDGLENRRFSQFPDREFGAKSNPIIQILCNIEDEEKKLNIEKFLALAKEYASAEYADLEHFLYHLEIMQRLGIEVDAASTQNAGVRIMTNHATKGLEYRIVIVSGIVQGKFPAERMSKDHLLPSELLPEIKDKITDIPSYLKEEAIAELERNNQLAEERRLCYVAFTRAKEKLVLTYARDYNNKPHIPSQFLNEIDYTTNSDVNFEKDDTLTIESKPVMVLEKNTQSRAPPKPKRITFSPSALLLFTECQKKYEYKYRYQMPEKQPISWEDIRLGSFVHEIIEEGIKHQFRAESGFLDLAHARYAEEEWRIINLDEALTILRVFFQRNKHKYDQHSLTEQKLHVNIDGLEFEGYADRIDIHPEGLEIIDYKTGKSFITAQHRNWQLGLYALAAPNLNLGPVRRLTLDMLRHEKPLEFDLGDDNIAREINSPKTFFNLHTVKQELMQTAQQILACYDTNFKPCHIEKNCGFCNEFVWKN